MSMEALIESLSNPQPMPNVFNPWRDRDPMDASEFEASRRRDNLRAHFSCSPKYLMVGEAPGYQGCHFSGIPFTSERLITLGDIPRLTDWNRITTRPLTFSEPSATIIWRALHENGIGNDTVLWNSFAFHPHRPNRLMSNRRPTQKEIEAGLPILAQILTHFSSARIVAVGATAENTLKKVGATLFATIRHPAFGGAPECREGIQKLKTSSTKKVETENA